MDASQSGVPLNPSFVLLQIGDERRRMKKSSYWRGQLRSSKVLYLLSKVALFSLSEFCGLTVVAIHFSMHSEC